LASASAPCEPAARKIRSQKILEDTINRRNVFPAHQPVDLGQEMKALEGCAEGAAATKGWCVRKNKNETSVHQLRDEGGCRSWRSVDRLEDSGARGHRAVDMGGDSARSRSVRLVMLGLAAAVGVVCLGAVSHVSQNSKGSTTCALAPTDAILNCIGMAAFAWAHAGM